MKTFEQLLACAEREAAMRKRVYPNWVEKGKMSAEKAKHEIECMEDIAAHIRKVKDLNEAYDDMLSKSSKIFG